MTYNFISSTHQLERPWHIRKMKACLKTLPRHSHITIINYSEQHWTYPAGLEIPVALLWYLLVSRDTEMKSSHPGGDSRKENWLVWEGMATWSSSTLQSKPSVFCHKTSLVRGILWKPHYSSYRKASKGLFQLFQALRLF